MPEVGVSSSKKAYTIKAETEGSKVDQRRVVLGSAQRRRRKACKISLVGGGSHEDLPTLKSVKWLER